MKTYEVCVHGYFHVCCSDLIKVQADSQKEAEKTVRKMVKDGKAEWEVDTWEIGKGIVRDPVPEDFEIIEVEEMK